MKSLKVLIVVLFFVVINVYAGEAVIPGAVIRAQDFALKITVEHESKSVETPGILLAGGLVVMPFSESLMKADSIYANIGGESVSCIPLGIDNGAVLLLPESERISSDSGVNFPQPTSPKGEAFYLVTIDKVIRIPVPAEQDIDPKSVFGGLLVDNYGAFYGIVLDVMTGEKIKNFNILPFWVIDALIQDVYEAAKKLNEKSGKEQIRIRSI